MKLLIFKSVPSCNVAPNFRLGVKNGCSEPLSGIPQHKPSVKTSVFQPANVQSAPLSKMKLDAFPVPTSACRKPPTSSQPKSSSRLRPPLPSAHSTDCSVLRVQRPSLDESITPTYVPLACPAPRGPTLQQLRADALPTAVMNFVAEADELVGGR